MLLSPCCEVIQQQRKSSKTNINCTLLCYVFLFVVAIRYNLRFAIFMKFFSAVFLFFAFLVSFLCLLDRRQVSRPFVSQRIQKLHAIQETFSRETTDGPKLITDDGYTNIASTESHGGS